MLGGRNSFSWVALLYPWYVPYSAECWARGYQVLFFKSLVWLNLRSNSRLPGHAQMIFAPKLSSLHSIQIPSPHNRSIMNFVRWIFGYRSIHSQMSVPMSALLFLQTSSSPKTYLRFFPIIDEYQNVWPLIFHLEIIHNSKNWCFFFIIALISPPIRAGYTLNDRVLNITWKSRKYAVDFFFLHEMKMWS